MMSKQRVHILQHPKETNHAKNTVRLITLCLPDVEVLVGESPEDFASLKEEVLGNPADFNVFYPHVQSQCFEEQFSSTTPANLIFIDATWRKAYKIWQHNPWLHCCQSWHFETPPASRYAIRQTKVEGGISTLEALAYVLEKGFDEDSSALLKALDAMQHHPLQHRPD